MLRLNYDAAHRFVESHPNATWNGWTLELFKPTPAGFTRKDGAFRNGRWGTLKKVEPNSDGLWIFRV